MGTENTQSASVVDYAAVAKGAQEASKQPLPPPQRIPELEGAPGADADVAEQTDPGETQAAPPKPVEPKTEPPKPVEQKSELEVSFEKVVRQSNENRKMIEAAKPGIDLANSLGVQNAQVLHKAVAARDPLSALAALGFSYKDVANAVIGSGEKKPGTAPVQKPNEPQQPQQPQLPPEVQEMLREHKQLKAERERNAVQAEIKRVVGESAGKFKLISALEATEEVAVVLEEMFQRGGGAFPAGMTPSDVIRIAAEEAEARLGRQKARWSKVLTEPKEPATVPPTATETPGQPAQDGGGKTLTNAAFTAPAAGVPPSSVFDVEDLISKLKNDPNMRK